MSKSFSIAVGFMQVILLALWEALGLYFGWSALSVFLVWLVGVWTLNIGTASALHTYLKLTQPPRETTVINNLAGDAPIITEADGVE